MFGRSVNPKSNGDGKFCPALTTGTPKFFHLPAIIPGIPDLLKYHWIIFDNWKQYNNDYSINNSHALRH